MDEDLVVDAVGEVDEHWEAPKDDPVSFRVDRHLKCLLEVEVLELDDGHTLKFVWFQRIARL